MRWRLYFDDFSVVEGETEDDWRSASDNGVIAVAAQGPYADGRRPWRGVDDRRLWTGDDEYDPFDYGPKRGTLIPDRLYFAIWERARSDPWLAIPST